MRVLLVEPQKVPREIEIPEGLKALQEAVGESIEATYPFEDFVALVTNGNGKFDGSQLNRALRTEDGEVYDIIAGNFLVVGLGSEDFASLSNELLQNIRIISVYRKFSLKSMENCIYFQLLQKNK